MQQKWRERQLARALRAKGKSINEIQRRLGVSKSSVSVWVRDVHLGLSYRQRLAQRKRLGAKRGREIIRTDWLDYRKHHPKPLRDVKLQTNLLNIHQFFSSWSAKMAYVLGFFAADGCMYHSPNGGYSTGGYYIVFTSTEIELLQTVRCLIQIRNKIECHNNRSCHHRDKYYIRIVNKNLYHKLLSIGMTPRKSLTLLFPSVPTEYLCHFVRGYLDGDGHVYVRGFHRKDNARYRLVFQAGFTSGSYAFLHTLQARLYAEAKVGLGSLHKHGSNWALSFSMRDTRQLYYFLYPTSTVPCLERKREKFELGIKLSE